MAADYAGQYTASHPNVTTPSFAQRVEMGLLKAAGNIYSETFTKQTPARQVLASKIAQPGVATNYAPVFVEYAAVQGFACDATTTDAQIDGVVSSEWNLVANA